MRGRGVVDSHALPANNSHRARWACSRFEEELLSLPKFTPVLDVHKPVGWLGRQLFVEREAHLDRDLPVPDLSIFDMAAGFNNLEPPKITQAAARFGERVLDRILDAIGGRAHKFDLLVDMIAHSSNTNAALQPTPI